MEKLADLTLYFVRDQYIEDVEFFDVEKKTDRNSPIKSLTVKLSNDLKFLTRFLNGINESFSEEYAKESDNKNVIFMRDSNRTSGYIPFKFDLTKEYIKQFF